MVSLLSFKGSLVTLVQLRFCQRCEEGLSVVDKGDAFHSQVFILCCTNGGSACFLVICEDEGFLEQGWRYALTYKLFSLKKRKMKSRSKNGWKSIMPHSLRGESATRFCIFPKVKSASYSKGDTPVYLNVYDLTPANGYVYWAGLGIFHSGVEVHSVEYAFGAHDYATSGVFEIEPRQCPGFRFRKSIFMGTTTLDPIQVREFMERMSSNYNGDTYHLIVKNCNHFCEDICYRLTGNRIPRWVNRLAKIGSVCNCILPESLKVSAVRHDPNFQGYDSEKKRLRSSFGCFSSISMHQKEVSLSSLFMHSQYKGCLPSWEFKRSKSRSLKEG